jgi:hypothetical protein
VNRFPYRVEPALHLYSGLLLLQLSSLSLPPPSSGSSGIARPPGAPFLPPFERPRDDAILAAATHHLQGAVNAGAAQAGIQRARAAVVRRREERKAAKKRKRAADGEATGDEYDEAPPPPPPPPGDQSDEEEGDDELPQGEWAAELARSYLDMVRRASVHHSPLSRVRADLSPSLCSSTCRRSSALRRATGLTGCATAWRASRRPDDHDLQPLSQRFPSHLSSCSSPMCAIHLIQTARLRATAERRQEEASSVGLVSRSEAGPRTDAHTHDAGAGPSGGGAWHEGPAHGQAVPLRPRRRG